MILKKIIWTSFLGLLFSGVFLYNWVEYVYHLGHHQISSILSREKITPGLIQKQTENKQQTLKLIQKVKREGEEMYGLESSKSYEQFVELKRDVLGWNLTVAPELELKAKEFGFPIVGKFGYLGFFNNKLKEKWKKEFIKKGYDVYENQIGAYSTLGYFQDPVFSTYLLMGDSQVVRMVLHEMAHEKLYFRNDTDFSESLASFIEKPASNFYFYGSIKTPVEVEKKVEKIKKEYGNFQDLLDKTRSRVEAVYSSKKTRKVKLEEKEKIFTELYSEIQKMKIKYLGYIKKIPRKNLNNAYLVQSRRYSPAKENGFKGLLEDDCKGNFKCWFDELKKLEKCPKDVRKKFSTTKIRIGEALEDCN